MPLLPASGGKWKATISTRFMSLPGGCGDGRVIRGPAPRRSAVGAGAGAGADAAAEAPDADSGAAATCGSLHLPAFFSASRSSVRLRPSCMAMCACASDLSYCLISR